MKLASFRPQILNVPEDEPLAFAAAAVRRVAA